ncbi:MAG: hypothetical protein ACREPA_12290 [Candidatus Dormibacteraceae bacterium]
MEPVYVPGQSGAGTSQSSPGSGSGAGIGGLVPYGRVIGQYSADAQAELDREFIPEQDRQLVQAYFSALNG